MNTPMKPTLPEVKFTKNGYEIRTEILSMAKSMLEAEYHYNFEGWKQSGKIDQGQLVTTVTMTQFPGLDTLLDTAKKMYEFVCAGDNKK